MKIRRKEALVITTSLGVVLLGVTVYSSVTNILTVATIAHSHLFDGPAAVTVRTLTLKPGDALPWHYHPGYAFSSIKSGTLTVEDGCGQTQTLTPGQGFEEIGGRVHRARNLGTTDVVVYNTFITLQGKPAMMEISGDEQRCGPPLSVDECRNENWRRFTHPVSFKNEGQCLALVHSHAAHF
jgi:quercetin dioxygenase-like cupin family protein